MEQLDQENKLPDLKNLSGGLEILVELAEKGEIDPWDIDILKVTDKYLALLDSTPRENLLNAGRAIFFASVLLRLKSDILLNLSNETLIASQQTEDFFPEDELLETDGRVHLDISRLDSFLARSSIGKQQRKRPISLGDLIFALQQAEEEEERRALRARLRAEKMPTIVVTEFPEDVLEIAHEEDVEQISEKVEAVIQEHLTSEKPITLSFLREIINDEYKPFLALMFLAHSKKVTLEQNEFYGEVYIYKAGIITEEEKKRQEEEIKEKVERERLEKEARKRKKKKKKSLITKIKEKISGNPAQDNETMEGN